jgi:hypothetical protein
MKNIITSLLKAAIQLLASSYLCHIIYIWNDLDNLFKLKIEYFQWVAIVVIVQTLIPVNLITSSILKKDDK